MPPGTKTINIFLLLLIICSASFTTAFYSYLLLPNEQNLIVGDQINFPPSWPEEIWNGFPVYVETSRNGVLQINGDPIHEKVYKFQGKPAVVTEPGQLLLKLKLFGFIPLKQMTLDVLPEMKVIPGGHSVGVILPTEGVMVVGHSAVFTEEGETVYPGKEAGIEMGDSLLKINGEIIKNERQAAALINRFGQSGPVQVEVKHSGIVKNLVVYPRYCKDTKSFRIGLYIRDNAAGVGTITFYEPKAGKYGALGHMIMDLDVQDSNKKGKIVKADVQGIKPGKKGEPGEKIAMFVREELEGDIEHNSDFGIFGKLHGSLVNCFYKSGIPVAFAGQIKEGAAEIITVIEGDKLEKFQINITKILPQHQPTGKGLVIQVTDPRLLRSTGGIIQGMSGSPIIQNDKLIGAVTHVFVNDPTKGYGCLAEWMLLEAGLITKESFPRQKIVSKSLISFGNVS